MKSKNLSHSRLISASLLLFYAAVNVQCPATAKDSPPPPSTSPTSALVAPSSTAQLEQTYQSLKLVWDDCNQILNTSQDLLNEGKNAPPRKSWLDFYLDTATGSIAKLDKDWAATTVPPDLRDSVNASLSEAQSAVRELIAKLPDLQQGVQKVTPKNENAAIEPYWGPAHALEGSSTRLNDAITKILSSLSSSRDNLSLSQAQVGASTNTTTNAAPPRLKGQATKVQLDSGLKSISEAGKRIGDACTGLIGELERWNLLYGHPPQGGTADMFYGGGLTSQEVLTQYRYLPTTVFTMPNYVKLYSYRLPPRQNMLVHYTDQIGKLLNLMQGELESLNVATDQEEAISGPWDAVKKSFIDSRNQYLSLLKLVNASNDKQLQKSIREDEVSLGASVVAIYDSMGRLRTEVDDMKKSVASSR